MTGMKIRFGMHLDGERFASARNALGNVAVGPLGLLDILETQVGLLRDRPSQAERIVQYRDCLKRADGPSCFYHRSFELDELGTAQSLLAWRDLWHLHGWSGAVPANASPRLADMAQVESGAREGLAPSIGERLARVSENLSRVRIPVEQVTLADPLGSFPRRWQEVLAKLPIAEAPAPQAEGAGFLGKLQTALLSPPKEPVASKPAWEDDGTVLVVRAESMALSGGWLAAQLGSEARSILLVSPERGARLDAELSRAGLAREGLAEASAFRPTLQVLSLALEILWEPINFYGLVQFLTHPVCPVRAFARRKLAAKVADRPGIGGEKWRAAVAEIEAHYGEKAAAVLDEIRIWVEHPRYRESEGAPIGNVIERVQRLAGFFQVRLGDEDPARAAANNAAHSQCRACARALVGLQAQGVEVIKPRQLQILVSQATAQGSENPLLFAQTGAHRTVTQPGAAIELADDVYWWQLSIPSLPTPYPWARSEARSLEEFGVDLPSLDSRLAREAADWLRPVLAARRRLVLVLPSKGEEVHPLWQMIEALFERPAVTELEALLSCPDPATIEVERQPLPGRKRWWQLPADVHVPARETESYSSLDLFLFAPHRWLLQYSAALRPSRLVSLSSDFLLLGNIAHELVNRFYGESGALSMPDREFELWFGREFPRVLAEEGATLLMPGRGSDREAFRYKLRLAMLELRRQLALAAATRVESEASLVGSFTGGPLAGAADLVVSTKASAAGIVDMKWSGLRKYPEALRNNRHLQLAIYAELLRQTRGASPAVAYFILDASQLFAPDNAFFPGAQAVPSGSGENSAQLWGRFVESWKWRRKQFDAGEIEVAIEEIEPTPESTPPDGAIDPTYLNPDYDDFTALAGWEDS